MYSGTLMKKSPADIGQVIFQQCMAYIQKLKYQVVHSLYAISPHFLQVIYEKNHVLNTLYLFNINLNAIRISFELIFVLKKLILIY